MAFRPQRVVPMSELLPAVMPAPKVGGLRGSGRSPTAALRRLKVLVGLPLCLGAQPSSAMGSRTTTAVSVDRSAA